MLDQLRSKTSFVFALQYALAGSLWAQAPRDGEAKQLFIAVDEVTPPPAAGQQFLRSAFVQLNLAPDTDLVLDQEVELNLFDDLTVIASFERFQWRWPTRYKGLPVEPIGQVWYGRIVGDHEGSVVLLTDHGDCLANIQVHGLGVFTVEPDDGIHVIRQLKPGFDRQCLTGLAEQASGVLDRKLKESPEPQQSILGCDAPISECDDGSRIDILVLYTEAALATDPDVEAHIDLSIANTNYAYELSEIDTQLNLLYKGQASAVDTTDLLTKLRLKWDGNLDEIHAWRNALWPDLVCVIGGGANVAYVMDTEGPAFEATGFSTVTVLSLDEPGSMTLTFAHELGHSMGCHHRRGEQNSCPAACSASCAPGAFPYSFAHTSQSGNFFTIMAWGGFGFGIQHFSNPNVSVSGAATGIPEGQLNCADNARSINETSDTVAQFRLSDGVYNTTHLISRDGIECQVTDGPSILPSISDAGQFTVFSSTATDLYVSPAASDTNGVSDIFMFNHASGLVTIVSGTPHHVGNGASDSPAISGSGQYTVFSTAATNLITGDTSTIDIFSKATEGGFVRISQSTSGTWANDHSYAPAISQTGRFVAFESLATNLDTGDTAGFRDIFWRDRDTDADNTFDESSQVQTTRVLGHNDAQPDGASFAPAVSSDGNWIAFESDATNLTKDSDTNSKRDIFVRHRTDTTNVRISVEYGSTPADGHSYAPSISKDGRYIVFHSNASTFLAPSTDTNSASDVFLADRDTDADGTYDEAGATSLTRISVATGGTEGNGASQRVKISPNGKFVVFDSTASNFESPNNSVGDIFLRDLTGATTTRMSINSSSQAGNGASQNPAVSYDGRFIAFDSGATNLDSNDTNGQDDVFLRDRGPVLVGDLTGDFRITGLDLDILTQNWGEERPCSAADLDGDDDVDVDDLLTQINNWTG